MDTKLKYVRLKDYDQIIIFTTLIKHDEFKHLNPVSAGFCYVYEDHVDCFGESVSLKLKSLGIHDSKLATKHVMGVDQMLTYFKE